MDGWPPIQFARNLWFAPPFPKQPVEAIEPINVKRVTYEVFGPAGTANTSTIWTRTPSPRGELRHAALVVHRDHDPRSGAAVVAKDDSQAISCRIVVDGQVKTRSPAAT